MVQQLVREKGTGVLDAVEVVRQPQPRPGARDQGAFLAGVVGRRSGVQPLQELDLAASIVLRQPGCQLPGVVGDFDVSLEFGHGLVEAALRDPAPRTGDIDPRVDLDRARAASGVAHA